MLIMRCDSAARVENTRDDFPEPDRPVTTVMALLGMASETCLRLCVEARSIRMDSVLIGRLVPGAAWQ